MLHQPFYNPEKNYEENFKDGPFGAFADRKKFSEKGGPKYDFLGQKVYLPFGIPAGPLINGNFVKEALNKGFDIVTYKTVRTRKYPCHPWPNVLAVKVDGDLTLEKSQNELVGDTNYHEPLSITNSFGVPSYDPDFWQKDMARAVSFANDGQVVVGSFQGTPQGDGDVKAYIQDFRLAARLVKETGAKILEANLSCPNEGTTHLLCFDIDRSVEIAEAIKQEIGNTPLILKMAYFANENELREFIKRVGKTADGLSAINTIPAPIVDKDGKQVLPGEGRLRSGVCGHAIKWAGVDMVKRLKKHREKLDTSYTIIGVGGVTVPEDYDEYRKGGADVVQSATGAMWNPYLAQEIKGISISLVIPTNPPAGGAWRDLSQQQLVRKIPRLRSE